MLPEHLYPRMVHDELLVRTRAVAVVRRQRLEALHTCADAERYVKTVRRRVLNLFGPLPVRTPLHLRVTGVLERGSYRVEKIVFESRPGLLVTANVYVPTAPPPRGGYPAVLGLCGHSENGKAYTEYQGFSQALARQGFVALILDPLGQGERMHLPHRHGSPVANSCDEHNLYGKQLGLTGEWFGTWRAWDGIRALDVLLARPDVDRSRVGVTGVSGGGTLTTYMNALEPRFTMAAPGCFVTTYLHNLENELPADSEQIPPGALAAGLEMADFLIARAPRPVLLLTQRQDYFDPRGAFEAYTDLRRVYGLLGAGDRVRVFMGAHGHGYFQDARETMYRFFGEHAGVPVSGREPALTIEPDANLFATPRGQVRGLKGSRPLGAHVEGCARAAVRGRRLLQGASLQRAVQDVLQLPPRSGVPHFRVLRSTGDNDCTHHYSTFWSFTVESEPGIQAILQVWDPQDPMTASQPRFAFPRERELTLFLPHLSSRADVLGDTVPAKPPLLYSLDVRGMGKSVPLVGKCEEFFYGYGNDYMHASYALMLNENLLGRRVHDVLATLDLLLAQGTERVHLIGRGLGAMLAAYAALLHPLVHRVTLKNALRSYAELAGAPHVSWPLSFLPHGVLRAFDLPDCYRALRKKRLRMIAPWDARFRPVS